MKHYLLKSTALAVSLLFCSNAMAQGPNQTGTYYQSADKLKGRELKTALYRIIGSPKVT